jgi:hypothetical protein
VVLLVDESAARERDPFTHVCVVSACDLAPDASSSVYFAPEDRLENGGAVSLRSAVDSILWISFSGLDFPVQG